jgi:alkylation response protein AidB-like acyl-CoA dehydrogenase
MFAAYAFRLSDVQADLIGKARRFGQRVLAPRAPQHDRDATFPIENFRDMRGEGLLSICIPKADGGRRGFPDLLHAAAELGRYGATALVNMHVLDPVVGSAC